MIRRCNMQKIQKVIEKLNIPEEYIDLYGKYKAKILNGYYDNIAGRKNGKLILVTAINPTPLGEGKTTQSIGLSMALNSIEKDSIVVLREPSLGPVFGTKGGAVGGGNAKILPSDDIDLHFTGDFHSITSANNLLCAVVDNHIFQGNNLNINPDRIYVKRAIDMNDRTLRDIVIEGTRHTGFEITAACELMAICCLSENIEKLRENIDNILIGYTFDEKPIYAKQLKVTNAMVALLRETLNPNLVQTTEGTPCIVHLGPFANIAHGCNSIIATKMGLKLSEYCVTEAGFGADLGAEKFLNIKSRKSGIIPDIVVLVATIKALKYNGGCSESNLAAESLEFLEKGIVNLGKHIENLGKFNLPVVVCINKFESDTDNEIEYVKNFCKNLNVECEVSTAFKDGSAGAVNLANLVVNKLEVSSNKDFKFTYEDNDDIEVKIQKICSEIYGAKDVIYSDKAKKQLENVKKFEFSGLPICFAKTPLSLSDNPKLLGAPKDFEIYVKDIKIASGAGFIIVYAGDIMTMPGLGKKSKYESF
ncbi:MAG: formate--tetrahydrofolate ligase [Clostridia bacterium]|nr:formate--tetrahydrofolate ligase [Clostridia bacterium]